LTYRGERRLVRTLWGAWVVLGAAGLGVLAFALFSSRAPRPFPKVASEVNLAPTVGGPRVNPDVETLAAKRMSKAVAERPRDLPKAAAGPAPIDSLIRLKGVMDFGPPQGSVAVLELPAEQKTRSFQPGDKIGETGAVLKTVGETVVVEYDKRRWKLTYKGAQELPADPVGDNR
jgi:hypothetical protein